MTPMPAATERHEHAAAPRATSGHSWHIVTGEYPPQPGGVSDYTRMVARGLAAAGDRVTVWGPAAPAGSVDPGVEVRRLPGTFGMRSLRTLSQALKAEPEPYRLLVQYVPHAFGWKAANVLFCAWLRARRSGSTWVMFHEVAYPFDRDNTWRRNALAAVNRVMAWLVGGAASRAFVSIPGWRPFVESYTDETIDVRWLPVPSAIPVVDDAAAHQQVRDQYAGARMLVGHFGTYSPRITEALGSCLPALVARVDCAVLLLGRSSEAVARDLISAHPSLAGRVHGTGMLSPEDVSRHLGACDVMVQPYPDGVSSRRTSAMAALSHGRPMVTTIGHLTEPLWAESGAATLVPVDEMGSLADAVASLLTSPMRREHLAAKAAGLYRDRFDLQHTIHTLRGAA